MAATPAPPAPPATPATQETGPDKVPSSRWHAIWGPTRSVLTTLGLTALLMAGMAVLMARGPSTAPAPLFTAKTVTGADVHLAAAPNRPVVLYFWATWCSACTLTSPTVSNYAARHPEVEVIGVAVDDSAAVAAYLKSTPRSFTTVIDDGTIAKTYGISAYPTTFAIGKNGRVSWSRQGVLMPGELDLRAGE